MTAGLIVAEGHARKLPVKLYQVIYIYQTSISLKLTLNSFHAWFGL